jgi:sulfur relay protein TusB/DsrH
MLLHCFNSDCHGPAFNEMCASIREGDRVLLSGSAVTLARLGHPCSEALLACPAPIFALEEDLGLYGVEVLTPGINSIDYDGWLRLAIETRAQLAWC